MEVTPVSPVYQIYNRKKKLMEQRKTSVAQRYAALSQLLFDALVPFVNSYEFDCDQLGDATLPDDEPKMVIVNMGDIRRAQAALRGISTDIYA